MSQSNPFARHLMQFLQSSVTPSHAVACMQQQLAEQGFQQLHEGDAWSLQAGQGYYLIRGGSSLLAWRMGLKSPLLTGVRLIGAHTDSPCLRLKPQPEITRHGCRQLGVEVYGGALLHTWFDRELGLAGRIFYQDEQGQVQSALYDSQRAVAILPSLAIHLNREANSNSSINAQQHLPVVVQSLAGSNLTDFELNQWLANDLSAQGIRAAQLLDADLLLYPLQPPAVIGWQADMLSSARLDNLLSCYAGLQALLAVDGQAATSLLVCTDHEEVGSASTLGAEGPFLESLLRRLVADEQQYQQLVGRSLLVSCDNAHALHPNYPDKHDARHGPLINAGPVIKVNSNQRYATTAETSSLFASWCQAVKIPCQRFVVRSDMACGSTIGPIIATRTGIRTVDVGIPQWAMHSARETAGLKDVEALQQVLVHFLKTESLALSFG